MEKLTMRFIFIFTVYSSVRGLQVSIPQAEYEVARGDDITLTCTFVPAQTDNMLVIITWSAEADNPDDPKIPVATYYSVGSTADISPPYEGRVSMTNNIASRESTLTLTKVTMQENRLFQCRVQIPGDDVGTLAATTSLVVLVAPSVPIINVQGTAEYFNNINLTCDSVEGSPRPTYRWQSYDTNNAPRLFPSKTTEKNGVLSLYNISMMTSGFYVCTSTNKIRSASSNFTLSVMPPSMNLGATAGIIGGVLAGVLVLGIVIYCCCRKKKNKPEEHPEGGPEGVEFQDKPMLVQEHYRDDVGGQPEVQTKEAIDQYEERGEKDLGHPDDDDDAQHSTDGHKERHDDNRNSYGGSRDRLGDPPRCSGGSRDRLDENRDRYGGSRDRLEDQPKRYGDSRDRYGGSRDRLDDNRESRDRYGGSRDRLDDNRESRDRYGGSRDRLDDNRESRDRYGGSRDRLDDSRHYGGSRDRLNDRDDQYND